MRESNKDRLLWLVYLLAALIVSIQKILTGKVQSGYTAYENYIIFKNSFSHLIQGLNPYATYPLEQWDLYKYSPAFALAMAPFSLLPDWLGLQLWNLANAVLLLWAIYRIPILLPDNRRFLAWFILPELVVSMQNSQSNGLTAAFLLLAFATLERERPLPAAGWTAAGAFLKIFGIFAAVPALVYPQRRKYLLGVTIVSVFLALLPLIVMTPDHLWQVYQWWIELLREDHDASTGLSVQGWLETWFGWFPPKWGVITIGLAVLAASTAVIYRAPSVRNRMLLWASVLIWVVIFNHKAESPTFVIALSGVALWYLGTDEPPHWKKIMLWTAFVLASLSPTDIFPRALREQVVQPYVLKAVPCIAIWLVISWEILSQWKKPAPAPAIT